MEASKLKNMVILKNLPSNIIEEAIVILKNNQNAKKIERIQNLEKNKQVESTKTKTTKEKDYILKEAEMLINDYVSKIEHTNQKEKKNMEINKKYQKLKKYIYISSVIILIQSILLIINL